MNLHEEQQRGIDAKRVLAEPVLKEAWRAYEQRLLDEIANASRTRDEAEELRRLLIASRKARAHLERMVMEGNKAASELQLLERRRKWNVFRAA